MRTGLASLCGAVLCGMMICCTAPNAVTLAIPYYGSVYSVAFSPDGQILASGGVAEGEGGAGEVVLWDAHDGTLLRRLLGHEGAVHSVAFSPDGTTLASGGGDYDSDHPKPGEVILWDVQTGDMQRKFEADGWLWDAQANNMVRRPVGHAKRVSSVAFSPDGSMLASGSWDNTVRLWDVQTGELVRELSDFGGRMRTVTSVAFSPDGSIVASGGSTNEGKVRLWDPQTGELLRALEAPHLGGVTSVVFAPDGQTLASAGNVLDQTVKLWDPQTGSLIQTLELGPPSPPHKKVCAKSLAFSPDGNGLACACADWTVRLLDVATGALLRTITGHGQPLNAIAFSPDGTMVASGSYYIDQSADGKLPLRLWDVSGFGP